MSVRHPTPPSSDPAPGMNREPHRADAAVGATAEDPSPRAPFTLHRLVVASLAVISLIFAWFFMAHISRTDPWYRNTDMNMHNLVDALSINSDVRPNPFNQPALPLKYLLALDYRIRHELGELRVWNLKRFGASSDPLRELPQLIRLERVHSRVLVIIFIFAAAGLTYSVTRKIESAYYTVILLCGSSGLLFHGLLIRPELLCVGFGNILALLCTWRAGTVRSWLSNHVWLFLAGLLVGLATLEKLPGIFYLVLCYGWCWVAAFASASAESRSHQEQPPFWGGLLAAAGGTAAFGLLALLSNSHDALGPVVILRLRAAAAVVAVLPLLLLWPVRNRFVLFLLDRGRELALLGGGLLTALLLSHLLLRGVMSASNAAEFFAGALHFVVNPSPYLKDLLDAKPETGRVFMLFVEQTPLLFVGATAVAIGVGLMRSIPLQLRAFIALLWTGAVGMALVMSKRHHLAQYDIFAQVPLLLVLSLSLSALGTWWLELRQATTSHWAVPVIITASFVLMLTVWFRLQPMYEGYQNDAGLPVNGLTLTFLYDHDAHTTTYLEIMKTHYGDREQFATRLGSYLADPANRY